ncbi:MAG: hypothetical protein CVV24_00480 [Ignavibacteriae bacterium HGW-Ignavibacteriae-3]|nr:MAG: hypothetical protein CVV24_00480 [Ignavibacteriae bacterium HGW-Ignavibacteriae-3]
MVYKMKSSKILITCEEASFISVRKEEKNLPLGEKIKLFIHLLICKFCRLFNKQQKFLSLQIINLHSRDSFSDSEMEKMHILINSIADKN